MQIGHLGRFGPARIDYYHPALCVPFNLVEMRSRAPETMGLVWIAAQHYQEIAVPHVLGGVAVLRAKEVAVDPEVASLFLGQRVGKYDEPIARIKDTAYGPSE
jgi:hypothetical protein